MATERLSMRKLREILRQKWTLARSHRQVAASLGVSVGTVTAVLRRATHAGLDWPQVQALPDDVLEARLYGAQAAPGATRPLPDCAWIHTERRKPGVTLELLHLEYLEQHPTGYRYTRFCDFYRRWLARHRLSMRQEHRAGEKAFVDYAGQKPRLVDSVTGASTDVELFVGVLGASNYTYAEATATQQLPDWLASHARMFRYFQGVPTALVCDYVPGHIIALGQPRYVAVALGGARGAHRTLPLFSLCTEGRRCSKQPPERPSRVRWVSPATACEAGDVPTRTRPFLR